jgi:hypothetical protein
MSSIYNLDKLVRIDVLDERIQLIYSYKTKLTFLGLTIREAGIYIYGQKLFSEEDIEKEEDLFIRDKIVYKKPRCILNYVSGYGNTYYFNSLKEAEDFRDDVKMKSGHDRWIK